MSFEIFTEEDRQKERELLASYDLDIRLFHKLGLKIKQLVPERNCFRVESDKGFFCLKRLYFSHQEMSLMQEMTAHLKNHGFDNIFDIVEQDHREIVTAYEGNHYYLTRWMDGRESDFLNMLDIKNSIEALAKFHRASEGFSTALDVDHRRLYGRWEQGLQEKLSQIQAAEQLVRLQNKRSENITIVQKYLAECKKNALSALKMLADSSYQCINARDESKQGFIHHDYGPHNILHTFGGQTYIGGMECCAFDIRMHDLGYIIFRLMRRKDWDFDAALDMISYYDDIYKLEKEDYEALAVYFSFPHDYKQFYRLYSADGKEQEDVEEQERLDVDSEYNWSRKEFMDRFKSYAKLYIG